MYSSQLLSEVLNGMTIHGAYCNTLKSTSASFKNNRRGFWRDASVVVPARASICGGMYLMLLRDLLVVAIPAVVGVPMIYDAKCS